MSVADHPMFQPLKLNDTITLPNRFVQAPCTRDRANNDEERIPTLPRMADHYALRAAGGFGLLITEATEVNDSSSGYICTPGCHSDAQVAAWKEVVDAVKAATETPVPFAIQLWHTGRHSHPDYHNGELPIAPSAIPIKDKQEKLVPGWVQKPYVAPRAATVEEIKQVVADFASSASRAVNEAGFDLVEIHGANGYLIDQFLRDGSNQRTDDYGGSIENRARFLLEIVEATVAAVGADRVGLRLSPAGTNGDMRDTDPMAVFSYVMAQLDNYGLAYIHFNEERPEGVECDFKALRELAPNTPFIACYGYDVESGAEVLGEYADAVAFGRVQLANPDYPLRAKHAIETGTEIQLNEVNWATVFANGDDGYNDYPLFASAS